MALVTLLLSLAFAAPALAPGPARRLTGSRRGKAVPGRMVVLLCPLITVIFVATGLRITSVLALIMVIAVAVWQLNRIRVSRRANAHSAALAAFLGVCAGNLRAGMSMPGAMDCALDSAQRHRELTGELSVAARRAATGSGGAEVLIDATDADLNRLGTLWEVSDRHGIPLVTLLEQMRRRIDLRLRHRRSTMAALQGPQATAMVLTVLPLGGVAMGTAMGADPLGVLLGGGIGGLMLVGGVGCAAAGFIMTQKILEAAT
ncbi:type II secretion system F family protein [Corynebacterium pacaense]|uniref:type II secretion system F family protein n=1 Tax=Corynebacterium pacaense TaxID=1816684 RepID=UPI001FE52615|nr:type II secretion system F family protein [Corynebacterium pacaense]